MALRQYIKNQAKELTKVANTSDRLIKLLGNGSLIILRGVNVLVGQRGSGKTYGVFREMLMLNHIPNSISMILYVSDNPNDPTVKIFENQIQIPIDVVSSENAEAYIRELRQIKSDYDLIRSGIELPPHIDEEYALNILRNLHVRSFDDPLPDTIIIYDDAQTLFNGKSKRKAEYKWLFENRQPKITYYLNIQDWKGITPELKEQLNSIWIFGNYSPQRINFITQQIVLPIDVDEFKRIYRNLGRRDAFVIVNTDDITFTNVIYE